MTSSDEIGYIEPAALASLLEQHGHGDESPLLVVDVRDDDFEGGNIRITSANKKYIVFHCMQSQMRGPRCARKFVHCHRNHLAQVAASTTPTTHDPHQSPPPPPSPRPQPQADLSSDSQAALPLKDHQMQVLVLNGGMQGFIRWVKDSVSERGKYVESYRVDFWGFKL